MDEAAEVDVGMTPKCHSDSPVKMNSVMNDTIIILQKHVSENSMCVSVCLLSRHAKTGVTIFMKIGMGGSWHVGSTHSLVLLDRVKAV